MSDTTSRAGTNVEQPSARRHRWGVLIAFLLLTFLAAAGGSFTITGPGSWYQTLSKPTWNPPGWVFGPVWTTLYVMIAVSGWLVWCAQPTQERGMTARRGALVAWGVQWVLNAAWTPLFFVAQRPGLALVDIVLLLAAIVVTIALSWRVRPLAGGLLLPYAAWVGFATVLNGVIWWMNR